MNILLTGASSPLGSEVLKKILSKSEITKIWGTVYRNPIPFQDSQVVPFPMNLEDYGNISWPEDKIHKVVHFASLAHSEQEKKYWDINKAGTLFLAKKALEMGCKNFVYISSYKANSDAGAYGQSKLFAERDLLELSWDSLTIIRPSEVYGAGGNEGLDKIINMAKTLHIVPMFFGNRFIRFYPLHVTDFVQKVVTLILNPEKGIRIFNLIGPEKLTGSQIGMRAAKLFKAIPIPVYWPVMRALNKISKTFNLNLMSPDQLDRITSHHEDFRDNETFIIPFTFRKFLKEKVETSKMVSWTS